MYAEVNSARSIRSPLIYNEQKVEAKQARFLDAHNFWQEKDELTLRDKQQRFSGLTMLNERSEKKILHISVNFHPDDQLSDKAMTRIAAEFMKGIDFGNQPWLVYRHIDAGHPHIHIISTNIRPDGSRIPNDLRAPHHLIRICSAIERTSGLHAALAPHQEIFLSKSGHVQAVQYGAMPTRTGIETVLGYVTENYRFTSFESLNAILSLYNVRADRGSPDGIMYQNRGLYYRLIDPQGRKLGAPIKASDFHMNVTLDGLEEKYRLNKTLVKETDRERMRINVDYHLIGNIDHLGKFRKSMARDRQAVIIPALTRRPTRGAAPADSPGMFYLNFDTMTIFRDTDLGNDYTASAILRRCSLDQAIPQWVAQQQIQLKPGEKPLLDKTDPDHAPTRDLLLRLSIEHDAVIEKQQQLQQTHRHRLRL